MPFTQEQITNAQNYSLDFYLKNRPAVDQINVAHPLYKRLESKKKSWTGGLQNVVEQLRNTNDSNFQSYFGKQEVNFNSKRTITQAKYSWGNVFDGYALDEDELRQNGIKINPNGSAPAASDNEVIQLTNLMQENSETLVKGFEEGLDLALHRSNSSDANLPPGLDHLIQLNPAASSVVGSINQSTSTWWRNYAKTDIQKSDLINEMEIAWRETTRFGGQTPDFLLVGSDFLDAYRQEAGLTINRNIFNGGNTNGGVSLDAAVTNTYFKGVELVWDPVMDILDQLDNPAVPWAKRCYFINTRHLSLRPIEGSWMVKRNPPMVYNRFVVYFGLTSTYAMTTNKRRAHAVLSLY
jgi:hypothetical protein